MARIEEEKELTGSLSDIFKIRRHTINLFLMIYIWIASSFSLYLVNINIKNLPGDFFVNQLISALTDLPVSIFGGWAYTKFGLKRTFFGFFGCSVLGGLLIIIFGEKAPAFMPYMVSFAKGGVKISFDICYLANSFLFPAIFAGTSFGFCNVGAKTATVLSPMLAEV